LHVAIRFPDKIKRVVGFNLLVSGELKTSLSVFCILFLIDPENFLFQGCILFVFLLEILEDAKGMAIFAERCLEKGMQAVCEAEV